MNEIIRILRDIVTYGLEKIGRYYSRYRGYVADNNDPKNLGRIKVSVPEIYGDKVWPEWIWPEHNFAGPGYGIQCLPQKDSLVWVSFEKGDARKPLWGHGHFANKHQKDLPARMKSPNNFWFQTPKGLVVEFNDTDQTIRITAPNADKSKTKVIHIGPEFISLGTETQSAQPGVLGNTLEAKINALIDILKAAKVNTALGPQPFFPNVITQLEELSNSLSEIKSTTLTLD